MFVLKMDVVSARPIDVYDVCCGSGSAVDSAGC